MINTTTPTPAASSPHHHKNNDNVFPIAFGVSIGALSFLSVVLIASYYACSKKRAPLRRTGSISSNDEDSVTVDTTGLDDATVNSYPKLLYSHAKENDENTPDEEKGNGGVTRCSICLQEFKDSHVVRVLPECEHLFHVDCIDTWLKVQRTCPVCRSSPPPNRQRLSNGP